MTKNAIADAIPAATLVLLRDRPGEPPEIPMIGRGEHLVFAASRMVFPGGRIDEGDRQLAGRHDLLIDGPMIEPDDLAARIAAIRETIEEIGLAPGMPDLGDETMLAEIRRALHAGEPLSVILERSMLRIDPHALHPFARWRPDHELRRRFDTRFYLARAPELGEAAADGVESSHLVWGSARAHIAAGKLIFPTIRNLEWIAETDGFESAVARASRYPVETITPHVELRDGREWLCIPEGRGYPVTAQLLDEADRDSNPNTPSITRAPG